MTCSATVFPPLESDDILRENGGDAAAQQNEFNVMIRFGQGKHEGTKQIAGGLRLTLKRERTHSWLFCREQLALAAGGHAGISFIIFYKIGRGYGECMDGSSRTR
jgi:hypothetical protein